MEFQTSSTRRQIPAWLFSILLHSLIFTALLFLFATYQGGAGDVENRTGGIVLVDIKSETTEFLSDGEISDPAADQTQQPPPMPASEDLPPNLPGMVAIDSQLTGAGEEMVDSLTDADSLLSGTTSDQPFGGKVTTEVFWVKGTGSSFVYVFDRSGSMDDLGGRPLRAAKQQLLESLQTLGETQQFQIIFYNNDIKIFQPEPGQSILTFADEISKKRARSFIASIKGDGGTNHLAALKTALAYTPDVIFLLTDAEGGFSSRDLRDISDWNRGTVINAIEFGRQQGPGIDGSLRQLTRESLGQYIYKNAQSFRD